MSVPAVMFCKQFLAYTVHIDRCNQAIHKHSCRFQHNICVNYMHLYGEIGDASSFLRGSTSSYSLVFSQTLLYMQLNNKLVPQQIMLLLRNFLKIMLSKSCRSIFK